MAGLWSFTCVLPEEAPDHHEWGGDSEETEQPGTSYDSRSSSTFSYTSSGKSKGSRGTSGEFERGKDHRHRSSVNCYSGSGAHMLACFRAGAINLIVQPALQVSTSTSSVGAAHHHRQGGASSAVAPVISVPRAAFLDGAAAAAEQDSGDEPTSPVVTCIGQVKKDKPRTPPKPAVAEIVGDLRRLKSTKCEKPLPRFESSSSPSSPARSSKWRQILGGRRTPQQPQDEFHIDLNRFSSACSSLAKTDVKRMGTGTFLAKSLMMLQMEHDDDDDGDGKPASKMSLEQTSWHVAKPGTVSKAGGAGDEVLLWKRRSGAKPLMLDLKRRLD